MTYREHILVVDDDTSLLEQAEHFLSEKYEVSLAASGAQAIQYLQRGELADLILLDILMPQKDGYETLLEIHDIPGCGSIPVIFLTSLTDAQSELQGFKFGASDYITNPFNPEVLLARVELRLQTGVQLDERKLSALPQPLSDAELKVAKLLARSYSNKEIGNELHYALDTVKKLVSHILEKLDIKSRKDIRHYLK